MNGILAVKETMAWSTCELDLAWIVSVGCGFMQVQRLCTSDGTTKANCYDPTSSSDILMTSPEAICSPLH
jgi:hypothetical protein